MTANKQKERSKATDVTDEGRKSVMMDIDRFVNEGMAGGRTHRDQIERATDMPE